MEVVAGWWSKERPCSEAASAVSGRGSIGQWGEGQVAEGNNNFIQHKRNTNTTIHNEIALRFYTFKE